MTYFVLVIVVSWINPKGVRTIATEENSPRLGLGFGLGLALELRLGDNFPQGQLS